MAADPASHAIVFTIAAGWVAASYAAVAYLGYKYGNATGRLSEKNGQLHDVKLHRNQLEEQFEAAQEDDRDAT